MASTPSVRRALKRLVENPRASCKVRLTALAHLQRLGAPVGDARTSDARSGVTCPSAFRGRNCLRCENDGSGVETQAESRRLECARNFARIMDYALNRRSAEATSRNAARNARPGDAICRAARTIRLSLVRSPCPAAKAVSSRTLAMSESRRYRFTGLPRLLLVVMRPSLHA